MADSIALVLTPHAIYINCMNYTLTRTPLETCMAQNESRHFVELAHFYCVHPSTWESERRSWVVCSMTSPNTAWPTLKRSASEFFFAFQSPSPQHTSVLHKTDPTTSHSRREKNEHDSTTVRGPGPLTNHASALSQLIVSTHMNLALPWPPRLLHVTSGSSVPSCQQS